MTITDDQVAAVIDLADHTYRYVPTIVRGDASDDAHIGTLDITFARFGVFNEIDSYWEGRFLERLSPGAFKRTMNARADQIKPLFDHGYDPSIGNKVLGPVAEMGERDDGPFGVVPLLDTSYNRDLLPGFEAGLYGASYRFRVVKEEWDDEPGRSDHNPDGIPERTISEVKLYEFGPVTFPADPGTTVGLRSMTDHYMSRLAERGVDLSALDPPRRGTRPASTHDQNPPDPGTSGRSQENKSIRQAETRLAEIDLLQRKYLR